MAEKIFISGTRKLKWKNKARLYQAFEMARQIDNDLILDDRNYPYNEFVEKIRNAYAVILVSLGDISPNMILDAVRAKTPFILTTENGLKSRLSGLGVECNPENEQDITQKILWLAESKNYIEMKKKINQLNFSHSWADIAGEFLNLMEKR